MTTIHKFDVPYVNSWDIADITMPRGARVVHVGEEDDVIRLWAIVDNEATTTLRHFRVVGTGDDLKRAGEYLGTVHMKHLGLVFHVFDMEEPAE